MDDNKFLPKLSQNLLEILNDDEYHDITIEVGDDPYVKIFRAHMVILSYRSPYLRRILSTNKKNDGTLEHIKLSNILPETFQMILKYIYGGKLSLEEHDTSDIIKILITANELSLRELITYIQSFLIKNRAKWMEKNFNLTYKTSTENESFLELQNFCAELISKKPEIFFKSLDFISISEKSLISLIQHDNLRINGVRVWEYTLKWGLAQNPELPSSNPKSFSKDDFNALKNTIQRCIPFIKFYNFTSKEFLCNVLPFKKILPKELRDDLLNHFLNPDCEKPETKEEKRKTQIFKDIKEIKSANIDSNLITIQHAEFISKWVDKLEITDKIKNSYEFKLILRGSRDGFAPEKFHEICNNQTHTVMIVKVKGCNEILGGYSPIEWTFHRRWNNTLDSFTFSFKDINNIENHILSRARNKRYAMADFSIFCLSFANFDLKLQGIHCYCNKTHYAFPTKVTNNFFPIEEFEVFKII